MAAPKQPGLLDAGLGMLCSFSGQGADYLDELRVAYEAHASVRAFVADCGSALAEEAASAEATVLGLHGRGLDVVEWLKDSAKSPPPGYLRSAPVSYPLIGLTQLANVFALLETSGVGFERMQQAFTACTGHSQGVASAVALSWATSQADLAAKGKLVVKYLFWHGTRMQQVAAEVLSVSSEVAGSGGATPMLAVLGIETDALIRMVDSANLQLGLQTGISLVNAPTVSVVTGAPDALAALQRALLSSASVGGDASASRPFYKRKRRITTRFVRASAPFHSPLMIKAQGLIEADAKRVGLNVRGVDLKLPVIGTDQLATNLCTLGEQELVPLIVRMQATACVYFTTSLDAAKKVAPFRYAVDFGPGGPKGAAHFMANHLHRDGVRTILASPASMETVEPAAATQQRLFGMRELLDATTLRAAIADAARARGAVDPGAVLTMSMESAKGGARLARFSEAITVVTDL